MAIAVGSSTTGQVAVASALTFSHNSSACDLLLVYSASRIGTTTGVTYNGVSMTAVNAGATESQYSGRWFYKLAPASGSNNVICSYSDSSSYGVAFAINITGCSTTSPIGGNGNTTFNSGTSFSRDTTCSLNSVLFAGFTFNNSGDVCSQNGSQTSLGNTINTSGSFAGASSYKTASAGTNSMNYTSTNAASDAVLCTVEIKLPIESLVAQVTNYTFTANNSSFVRTYRLNAQTASYGVTTNNSFISKVYVLTTQVVNYALTTQSTVFRRAYALMAQTASYTVTAVNTNLLTARRLVAQTVAYTLDVFNAMFSGQFWNNDTKPDSTYTNSSKPTNSYSNNSKPSSSWTNDPKV